MCLMFPYFKDPMEITKGITKDFRRKIADSMQRGDSSSSTQNSSFLTESILSGERDDSVFLTSQPEKKKKADNWESVWDSLQKECADLLSSKVEWNSAKQNEIVETRLRKKETAVEKRTREGVEAAKKAPKEKKKDEQKKEEPEKQDDVQGRDSPINSL
jgi:hypothetical protein